MKLIYNLSILLYWIDGRKGMWHRLLEISESNSSVIWIHCSSLGEFEQGRPVIEKLKSAFPGAKILLSFFSPSGYRVRKHYSQCDWVDYMPLDTSRNAKRFLDLVKPRMVLFIKYEFWYHHLAELKKRGIPTFLISANFRESQIFFKWYGSWYRQMLHTYKTIFVQSELSKKLLAKISFSNVLVAGDTRFDRVKAIMEQSKEIPLAELFSKNHSVIVAGSTWQKDEDLLFCFIKNTQADVKLIIAPHEINKKQLAKLKNEWNGQLILFSEATADNIHTAKILVIDNVGMLSSLYRYGILAYVGGGFGKGIHNVLEAATYGMPILFGPNYNKFQEAIQLVDLNAAFPVANSLELDSVLSRFLNNEKLLKQTSAIAAEYVRSKTGATDYVLSILKNELI
jgi:3-deoxy-D-manno-octulosonic-acid transferase